METIDLVLLTAVKQRSVTGWFLGVLSTQIRISVNNTVIDYQICCSEHQESWLMKHWKI